MTLTLSQSQLANYPWCTSLQPPERTPSSNYKTADQHMQLVIYKNGGMAQSDSLLVSQGFKPHQRLLLFPRARNLTLLLRDGWFEERITVLFHNQTEVN